MFLCVDDVIKKSLKDWKSATLHLDVNIVWCKIA